MFLRRTKGFLIMKLVRNLIPHCPYLLFFIALLSRTSDLFREAQDLFVSLARTSSALFSFNGNVRTSEHKHLSAAPWRTLAN